MRNGKGSISAAVMEFSRYSNSLWRQQTDFEIRFFPQNLRYKSTLEIQI